MRMKRMVSKDEKEKSNELGGLGVKKKNQNYMVRACISLSLFLDVSFSFFLSLSQDSCFL